jgi:hypothetical protein
MSLFWLWKTATRQQQAYIHVLGLLQQDILTMRESLCLRRTNSVTVYFDHFFSEGVVTDSGFEREFPELRHLKMFFDYREHYATQHDITYGSVDEQDHHQSIHIFEIYKYVLWKLQKGIVCLNRL